MKHPLMLLGVFAAIVVAAAPPASADPTPTEPAPEADADFLQQLRDAGITFKDGEQAVVAAKSVCQWADAKKSNDDIIKEVQSGNPSLVGSEAKNFVILSANEYCPKYLYDH